MATTTTTLTMTWTLTTLSKLRTSAGLKIERTSALWPSQFDSNIDDKIIFFPGYLKIERISSSGLKKRRENVGTLQNCGLCSFPPKERKEGKSENVGQNNGRSQLASTETLSNYLGQRPQKGGLKCSNA